jgi:hypothetical protein
MTIAQWAALLDREFEPDGAERARASAAERAEAARKRRRMLGRGDQPQQRRSTAHTHT